MERKNKLQQIIKHIKTMFYNLWLCVSLKRDDTKTEKDLFEKEKCGKIGKIINDWLNKIKIRIYLHKTKKELIKQEQKRPLKLKKENLDNAKKFCKEFLNYMRTDKDIQEFYEDGDWNLHPFNNELRVGSGWNTGQRFNLEYIDVVQLTHGNGLHFRFNILKGIYVENGILEDGTAAVERIFKYVPTELNFYLQYFGDSFTVRTDNLQSNESNDFGFITNEIAKKLGE